MYRWFPSILKVVTIVQPETLVSWALAARRWLSAEPPNFHEVDDALSLIVKEGNCAGEVVGRIRALRRRERYMPLVAFCLSHSWRTSSSVCACLISDRHNYYNGARTHLSLNKDAPISRAAEAA